ncbi:MAG: TonB-dependent receptor [Armatimonadota bacterium]|nr:TonB-dependent receptor [Armatimonadota bacterium]
MSKAFSLLLAIGLAAYIAGIGLASDEMPEEPVFEVEVVGVSEPEAVGQISTSASVITRTEIQRSGAQNLMDFLVREPGVWVSRQGGMGYGGKVNIRGFGGSPPTQLAVLLDGHPTQMGIMGHILPTSYVLDNVKRIEILRGPTGALYGDMAVGGVIKIYTRGPKDEDSRGALLVKGGGFDTFGNQLWFRGINEKWGYRFQLGRYSTDGSNPFAKYDADNYSLAIDHTLRNGWDMAFRSQRLIYTTFDQNEVANAYAAGREPKFIEQDYDRGDYDLEFKRDVGNHSTSVKLYRTEGEHEFQDGFHSKDFGQGIILSQTIPAGRGKGEWGIGVRTIGGKIYSPASLARSFSRSEPSMFLLFDQPIAGKTTLSLGMRYTAPEDFGSEVLPHIGIYREMKQGWSLYASARRGYRLPSFRELFLFGINNPNLEPESAWQYEIGARRNLPSGAQVEISAFDIDAKNLIVLGPRPAGVPGPPKQYANTGAVTRTGFEISARWPQGSKTAYYANFSYLDAGARREQTVGHKLAFGVDYRLGKWMISGDLLYVNRLFNYDQTNTLVKLPSFTVVNVKASRPISNMARIGIVIENLFNRSYRVDPAYPYPMPGRCISLQFEKGW